MLSGLGILFKPRQEVVRPSKLVVWLQGKDICQNEIFLPLSSRDLSNESEKWLVAVKWRMRPIEMGLA